MRKISWPYIGDPELEMGSMGPKGDSARDIQGVPESGFDAFVSPKSVMPEEQTPEGYSGGVFFPEEEIYSELEDNEYQALAGLSENFLSLLASNSTVLGVGNQTDESASVILKAGHNLINLSKRATNNVNIHNFHQEYGNPMFHTFRNKFDGFYITNASTDKNSLEITLNNICDHLRPISHGFIVTGGSEDVSSAIEAAGLTITDKHIGKIGKYLVRQNNLNKIAVVRCYGKDGLDDASVTFRCDVAKTTKEKIDGLQVYSNLSKESGLLFPYDKPTDALYHMGSVNYPIDIIFIDKESKIKKICRNIQPGSLGVYGCSEVKSVLEISGGLSDVLGIKESNLVYIDYKSDFEEDLLKMANVIKDIGVDRLIFKRSNVLNSGFYEVFNHKIYVINNNDNQSSIANIIKKASLSSHIDKEIIAFDIDNLIIDNKTKIRLYRHKAADIDGKIFRGLYDEAFSIDKKGFIDVTLEKLVSKDFYENINSKYSLIPSQYRSFSSLNSMGRNKVLEKICKTANDPNKSLVFVSRNNNDKSILENFIQKEVELKTGLKLSISSELVRVPDEFGTEDIFLALKEKYSGKKVELYNHSFIKSAGIPVTDDVKAKARHALRYFDRSKKMCNTLVENLKKNLAEYQKVQGNSDAIANSKGQYNQSSKRNSRITKRMLINIKNGIKIMNEIKDISTTSEIISSIALAAKNSSDG
ncbi:hypothetical protein CMI41_04690, partial [Candidatus Pacearchaeota archaeon]|nr:hypothetical protein [Candidatus Pacearchaeota archaeon]